MKRPRILGVVTVARSDYGIYQPVLREIARHRDLRLWIYAGGMHLSRRHGMTVRMIEADGHAIAGRVDFKLGAAESPRAIAEAMGRGVAGFARAFARRRPDLLVALGDRYEMHAAALAALPLKIPVAHLHGGELTAGAMDDALRHCLTKLSHLHFPAAREYARRVAQLGEEPWRITLAGAPALDRLRNFRPWPRARLERKFGLDLSRPFLLATFHPVTLEYEDTARQTADFLGAIADAGLPAVFTLPNADTRGAEIARAIRRFVAADPRHRLVDNFGAEAYFSLMALAAAMVGNSSSGLLEAPSFGLPVVNIGRRQEGRLRARNILDVPPRRAEIAAAIRKAVGAKFRAALQGIRNPHGDGRAAERIVAVLRSVALDDRLLVKKFRDFEATR